MTDARFNEIERLVEEAGRVFDPATGRLEDVAGDDEEDLDLDPNSFLATLGISVVECAEYVQRKMRDYDESFRDS